MAKKTIGYIALEWTCPTCGSVNEGKARTCHGCGAQMPPDVAFHLPGQQALDKSEQTAKQAKAGPDIHCPFCGTRNPATAKVCSQCGGVLAKGQRREAGQVLGALDTSEAPGIACPSCGELNAATATECVNCGSPLARPPRQEPSPVAEKESASSGRRWLPILVVIGLIICALALFMNIGQAPESIEGTVVGTSWVSSVSIEQYAPVTQEAWHDRIPQGGEVVECWQKVRHTVDEPVDGALEVCGTPYVIDTGTGQGQVVQDCVYEVSDDWCRYTIWLWQPGQSLRMEGRDLNPQYATGSLADDQRVSGQGVDMKVIFQAGDRNFGYNTNDLARFQSFPVGSRWELEVNALGGAKPVRRIE